MLLDLGLSRKGFPLKHQDLSLIPRLKRTVCGSKSFLSLCLEVKTRGAPWAHRSVGLSQWKTVSKGKGT